MTATAARKPVMSRPQMRSGPLGFQPDRKFWDIKLAAEGEPAEILIYGYIGQDTNPWTGEKVGMSAQRFIEELREIPPDADLSIRINSRGGDVYDGTAIHAVLSAHKGKKTVYVDGLAASAASLIAMAGNEVVVPANAWLMIHDPSTCVAGTAMDLAEAIKQLESTKAGVIAAYAAKNDKMSDEDIGALMSATTWMTGAQAVEKGFADRVSDAVAVTNLAPAAAGDVSLAVYENVPEDLAQAEVAPEAVVETVAPPAPVEDAAVAELKALVATLAADLAALKEKAAPEVAVVENVAPPVETETAEAAAAREVADARAAIRREAVAMKMEERFDNFVRMGASNEQLLKIVLDGGAALADRTQTSSTVSPVVPAPKAPVSVDLSAAAYDYYANVNARPARAGSK